jgi:heat shock protein HtpX
MSLTSRALVAIALTIAFYALAVLVAAALIAAPFLIVAAGGSPSVILIAGPGTGITILVQLVPRRERFVAPGPRLTRDGQPEIIEVVEDVARAVGYPAPDATYLVADVNAGVWETPLRGPSPERVLVLGLPLLEVLTVGQLRAILAHEFGHYVARDTRIDRWLYRTRLALLRVSHMNWRGNWGRLFLYWARLPFRAYTRLFLRITSAVSRRQELVADALAARVAGLDAQVGAVRRTAACGPAFDGYWESEVVPALIHGLRPPIGEGFREFLSAERVSAAVHRELDSALEQDEHDPYDSHPTLRQRLAALGAGPDDDPPVDGAPAASLLRGHPELEAEILTVLTGGSIELMAASWGDIEQDWLRRYAVMVDARRAALDGRRIGDVPALAADPAPVVSNLHAMWPDAFGEHPEALARELVAAALTVALVRSGFAFEARPGEPLSCRRGEHRFTPFADVAEIADRPDAAGMLEARLSAAGVDGEPLVDPLPEPVPAVPDRTEHPQLERAFQAPGGGDQSPARRVRRGLAAAASGLGNLWSAWWLIMLLVVLAGPGMIVGYDLAGRAGEVVGGLASLTLIASGAVWFIRRRAHAAALRTAQAERPDPFVRPGGGR